VSVFGEDIGGGIGPVGLGRDGRKADGDESPEQALRRIVGDLASGDDLWAFAGRNGGPWGYAQICRTGPGRVLHVVGASPMALRLRELLAEGAATGWELHPVRDGRTPLHVLAEPLLALSGATRDYNLLRRNGFATVEELAATPDHCLLRIRHVGPKTVAAVHQVLRDLGWDSLKVAHPAANDAVAERRWLVMKRLAEDHRVRYREFADMLARSSMPLAALEKIADSLNAEATPPADPLVCLSLHTAGEADLAMYYQRTHAAPTDPAERAEGRSPEPRT
jgi:Bacterial RNA polymerase, alpha chain C terminal domain